MRILRGAVKALLLVLGPAVALIVAYAYLSDTRYVSTDNAYLKADIVAVSAEIDGRVAHVLVDDNAPVAQGDILFELDRRPFEIALREAEAQLAAARHRIASLRANLRQSEIEIELAQERLRFVELDLERQRELRTKGIAAAKAFQAAAHDVATARQQVVVARQRNVALLADLGGDANLDIEAHPIFLQAKARRDRAALDLERSTVRAPAPGFASNVRLTTGEYVEAGDAVMALVGSERIWVEANLKEVKLTHLEIGQIAEITVDAYPDATWSAKVHSIANATGAEFSVLPPQNATGNWVKVVQRVPVRMTLDPREDLQRLRAGMSVTVRIDTGRRSSFELLADRVYATELMQGGARP